MVIGPPPEAPPATEAEVDAALAEALARASPADAAAEVSKLLDRPRKALYRRALELKGAV